MLHGYPQQDLKDRLVSPLALLSSQQGMAYKGQMLVKVGVGDEVAEDAGVLAAVFPRDQNAPFVAVVRLLP